MDAIQRALYTALFAAALAGATGSGAKALPFIDWASLQNPILSVPDRMLKDPAVVYHEGYFYFFCSTKFDPADPERDRKKPVFYRTQDFRVFEELYDEDIAGAGSPDVIKVGDTFYMVFQRAVPPGHPTMRRLFYSTSEDLVHWTPARELAPALQPEMRHIDGALAYAGGYFYLGYKGGQAFYVTRSVGPALDGRWLPPQRAWPGGIWAWAENFQFLNIDGTWRLVATSRAPTGGTILGVLRNLWRELWYPYCGNHEPYLFTIWGTGTELRHWARWTGKTLLDVPHEGWNTVMHANSAYLCDWRQYDGYFYLFYAGSADGEKFEGRGHGKIGVVRSRDLIHWRLPGDLTP